MTIFAAMQNTALKDLAIRSVHEGLGAKMVPFAGYLMPLQYTGLREEHLAVRSNVGVFDVSHMGEFIVSGPNALDLIQKVTSNDASTLSVGKVQYSCFPNGNGGIVDDLLVYRLEEEQYCLVVNASNLDKDWEWVQRHNEMGADIKNISEHMSLFAVQGPNAKEVVKQLCEENVVDMPYYTCQYIQVPEVGQVLCSTTGYTGAGGYELYVPNAQASKLWNAIMKAGAAHDIMPCGLAARDTLRLEMGFCLYGNDIDDTTSPLEAGLGWITKFTKDFIDRDRLEAQKAEGVSRRLIGFEMKERGIPRQGYILVDAEGAEIGQVTSGTMSPSLDKAIGMGYVQKAHAKTGSEIFVQVRNKTLKAEVVKCPFFKA